MRELTKSKSELLAEIAALHEKVAWLEDNQKQQNLFEAVFKGVPDALILADKDRNIFMCNPGFTKVFGYEAEEVIGKRTAMIYESEEEYLRQGQERFNLSAEEKLIPYVVTYRRKDGSLFQGETVGTIMLDNEGNMMGFLGLMRDITRRIKAETDLKLRGTQLRSIIEATDDGLLVTDETDCISYANQRFYSMWKIPGHLQVEKKRTHLIPHVLEQLKKPELFESYNEETLTEKKPVCHILEFKDGRVFERLYFPLEIEKERIGNVWSFRDVTQRVEVELQRLKFERDLHHKQKLESLGVLAGGIAHEFNNLLGVVIGYTDLAINIAIPESKIRRHLEKVMTAAERSSELVKRILSFGRVDEENQQPISIVPIVREALKLMSSTLPSYIEIHQSIDIPEGEAVIMADETRVHQVMMNLCTNASHAMGEGGGLLEVTLELKDFIHDKESGKAAPCVELTVKDSGHGMEADVMERIFDPFFTTKEVGKGTGMGLSLTHGIIKSMNGVINVFSQPGEGTTFQILLPLVAEEVTVKQKEKHLSPVGSERILLVDDEDYLVCFGQEVLEELGYQVYGTTNSLDALSVFKREPLDFDLIITDFTMPRMTGIQLAEAVNQIRPEIPIIMCTGFGMDINMDLARRNGINELVLKPVNAGKLARIVRKILDQHSR